MALPIITADQTLLVQAIIVYLYADPGLGKHLWALLRIKLFHLTLTVVLIVQVNSAAVQLFRFSNGKILLTSHLKDLAPYKTIVIDTVGAMLECIKTHLLLTANNRQKMAL